MRLAPFYIANLGERAVGPLAALRPALPRPSPVLSFSPANLLLFGSEVSSMAAILPILLFVVAILAINMFEFGRPD